ncbi:unnamed protein product, partial [Prorocentrum cordatum]
MPRGPSPPPPRAAGAAVRRARGGGGEPAGPARTYLRACARLGCAPSAGLAEDLAARSALIVDLRTCDAGTLAAVRAVLGEASANGLRQVVLMDGITSLGSDPAYQRLVEARRRRACRGSLGAPALRALAASLGPFLAGRGRGLVVLDLAGAPLGRERPGAFGPIVAGLREGRGRQLQWLGLGGCLIGDAGLAALLPWLAGRGCPAPSLEALVLARNGLTDVCLVRALLRSRARLFAQHRAAPLRLLDLSGNPRLGDQALSAPGSGVPPA